VLATRSCHGRCFRTPSPSARACLSSTCIQSRACIEDTCAWLRKGIRQYLGSFSSLIFVCLFSHPPTLTRARAPSHVRSVAPPRSLPFLAFPLFPVAQGRPLSSRGPLRFTFDVFASIPQVLSRAHSAFGTRTSLSFQATILRLAFPFGIATRFCSRWSNSPPGHPTTKHLQDQNLTKLSCTIPNVWNNIGHGKGHDMLLRHQYTPTTSFAKSLQARILRTCSVRAKSKVT
jgi:hypothetical protein